MNRLDRRLIILRAKRGPTFDRAQYYLERAVRARAARKVRFNLRINRPVVLVTPRWSLVQRFLDDTAVDLELGAPRIQARTLDLSALQGRAVHYSWTWLVEGLTELCGLQGHLSGPAWQAVDSRGFRHVLTELLQRSEGGERRCLMLHGLQYLHLEARDALIQIFEGHMQLTGPQRKLNLLLAGSVDTPHFVLRGGARLHLPDFTEVETIEALVEALGPQAAPELAATAALLGGVPAMVEALGTQGSLTANTEQLWKAMGPLAREMRMVVDNISSDVRLSRRLEQIARHGRTAHHPEQDLPLVASGLVRTDLDARPPQVSVRAPVIADLALHG